MEEIGFCIITILILPGDLRAENTVIMRSERTTFLLEFIRPIKAAGLRGFVDDIHHVLVCLEGFVRFTCREECLAPFLVCCKTQRLKVPAEEHDEFPKYFMNTF